MFPVPGSMGTKQISPKKIKKRKEMIYKYMYVSNHCLFLDLPTPDDWQYMEKQEAEIS